MLNFQHPKEPCKAVCKINLILTLHGEDILSYN